MNPYECMRRSIDYYCSMLLSMFHDIIALCCQLQEIRFYSYGFVPVGVYDVDDNNEKCLHRHTKKHCNIHHWTCFSNRKD